MQGRPTPAGREEGGARVSVAFLFYFEDEFQRTNKTGRVAERARPAPPRPASGSPPTHSSRPPPPTWAARGSSHQEIRQTGREVSSRTSASVTGVLRPGMGGARVAASAVWVCVVWVQAQVQAGARRPDHHRRRQTGVIETD